MGTASFRFLFGARRGISGIPCQVSQSTLSGLVLEIKPVLKRFLTNMPQRFEVAKNHMLLHGAVIEIDDATGKTIKIQRVSEPVLSASDESWIEHQNV
jgi:hypothetical protein